LRIGSFSLIQLNKRIMRTFRKPANIRTDRINRIAAE
jgi:hypothetical protein